MFKEMTDAELLDFCENNFCEYKVCQALKCEDNCKDEDCPLCQLFERFEKNAVIVPGTNVGCKSEWISVDERLPETEGKYLVCTSNGNIGVENFINYYGTGKHLCFDTWAVTHWMPLPKAPKMKGSVE